VDGKLSGSSSNSKSEGFFDNSGAVGGTFAVVGLICAALVGGVFYYLWRRRKAQRMDADVVAAASAAAATSRTPFDDDDPEMIEGPSYGTGPAGGAAAGAGAYGSNSMMQHYYNNYVPSSESYEPSHLSAGTAPGYAGMGAYGPMTGGAAAAGAAGYYAGQGGADGSHYYEGVPANGNDGAYGGMGSMGHENAFSQSAHDDAYAAAAAGAAGYDQHGAPQLNWTPGTSPPMNAEAYAGQTAYAPEQGANVFADPSSSSNETDGRIDMTAHGTGSAISLRDDQDYGRRLAVRNSDE
jgi:hypothetical protein